ncbi:MAG TPA: right-handed parallel beta-helix repeat-containing protein [Actinokineospora sp.]|nr:right-handed parallel beta-helix repeat-containing protein [Actinokineospora sp.]
MGEPENTNQTNRRAEISRRAFVALGAGVAAGAALEVSRNRRASAATTAATTYYVAKTGSDTNAGTSTAPLLTIGAAAQKAQPGDRVEVSAGVYREEIVLPRGGTSDTARITYVSKAGASVTITGADLFTGWTNVSGDVWQLKIANSYFKGFNPYAERVFGDWFDGHGRIHRRGMVYLNGDWLPQATSSAAVSSTATGSWWSDVEGLVEGTAPSWKPTYSATGFTTITAKFPGVNPNNGAVEVSIRGTVFKPAATNYNYITISGFILTKAATNWAAPTMGQWGLVSAHWCKGWVIEQNEISYSRCCGVALGKYSDQYDGYRGTTDGYYLTISDAQATGGWTFANIGGHVVRNNNIHHCGQTGVVGSLGAIGSKIQGNEIYQINMQGIWGGAEMAGIKLHGAIDVEIIENHIYQTAEAGGIWLDWMAQGTRVVSNLFHHNRRDIFTEVDHGPILIANNILLSSESLLCNSTGVASAHNVVNGYLTIISDGRQTPYMTPHTTTTVARHDCPIGGHQWRNNVLGAPVNMTKWDGAAAAYPISMRANVYTSGSVKTTKEVGAIDASTVTLAPTLAQQADGWYLTVPRVETWRSGQALISTSSLAVAPIPNQTFTNPDGSAMSVSTDYLGTARTTTPFPGPFETAGGATAIKVWPRPGIRPPGGGGMGPGNITVEVHGTDDQTYQRVYQGGVWSSGFSGMGGPNAGKFTGAPAVTMINGRTDVLVRGTDNALWHRRWTAAGWSAWTSLGGVLTDSPAAATDSAGNITVMVHGTDGRIYQKTYQGGVWSGFSGMSGPTGGTFTGVPAVTMINGRTDLLVRGTDNALWHRRWTSAGWTAWTSLGGILFDSPGAATDLNGNITVEVRGNDNQMWQKVYQGGAWSSGFSALGGPNSGTFTSAPAVSMINGRTDVFVRGTDNQLWQRTWTAAGGWTAWTPLGGVLTDSPAAAMVP